MKIAHIGPPLEDGPLPALIYFSLSAEESLHLDPFNQPVVALQNDPLRVFSFTLPGHGDGFDKTKAIDYWASEMAAGSTPLTNFIDQACEAIDRLISDGVIDPNCLAIAGLSRGAFLATHVAAKEVRIKTVVGFAPLTNLALSKSFADQPEVGKLSLIHLIDKLLDRDLCFYIGNNDTLVDTASAFTFIHSLAKKEGKGEMVIARSIGRHGHGTSPETFSEGASFIRRRLL